MIAWKKSLNCPPFGKLKVDIFNEIDDLSKQNLKSNLDQLIESWSEVWPAIHEALWNVVTDYEHEESVQNGEKLLRVELPDFANNDKPEWSVTLEVEPFAGVYDVRLEGTEVVDSGATF